MKSFTLKALAVAVLGFAGVHAAIACPTAVTTSGTTTPGGGGAWSSQFIATDATLNIVAPGLNSTGCALAVSIGALSNSRVFVQDNSPQAPGEGRYRFRYYIDISNLTGFTVSNQTAILFRVNDTTGPAQFTSDELVVRLAGGATPTVRFFVSDGNAASGLVSITAPLPAGANGKYRIEGDLQVGAAAASAANGCTTMPASGGCFRYWVTDAAVASTDAAPTGSYVINNSGWSGAKTAFLGLTTGTGAFRTSHAGQTLLVDEFDSRRQTFIGQ
jgi:hypothetical protein